MARIDRLLVSRINAATAPVVIIEGARGVGKTFLVRNLIDRDGEYAYVSLSDPRTLDVAKIDTVGWLKSLGSKVIIDEAQLLPGIQLVVKDIVDFPEFDGRIVLTGSASLPRNELGGQAPLARRSQSFKLQPLTQWELGRGNGSVLDALFDAPLSSTNVGELATESILDMATRGGFPTFSAANTFFPMGEIRQRVLADIRTTLSDPMLPSTSLQQQTASDVLDGILREPGGIVTYEKCAQATGLDRRTVKKYLDILERLHLVYWLPNMASTAKYKESITRSKAFPVDPSFAVARLSQGPKSLTREDIGRVFEAMVVSELRSSAAWASREISAWFWRPRRQHHEVDMVLVDEKGRRVGVEVKLSSRVGADDASGLVALKGDGGLHRGFVVYPGSEFKRLREGIWALPVRMLFEPESFGGYLTPLVDGVSNGMADLKGKVQVAVRGAELNQSTEAANEATDVSVFLSYVQSDDRFLGGRIVQFAEDLAEAYESICGQSIDIFVDRNNINWGQNWEKRLNDEIDQTAFLLAAVSPRYLVSKACIDEFTQFRALIPDGGRVILPLSAIEVDQGEVTANPVYTQLREIQFVNEGASLEALVDSEDESAYRRFVKETARALRKTVKSRVNSYREKSPRGKDLDVGSDMDLVGSYAQIFESNEKLKDDMELFNSSMEAIGREFSKVSLSSSPSATEMRRVFGELSQKVARPTRELEQAVDSVRREYSQFDAALEVWVRASLLPGVEPRYRNELIETMRGLVKALDIPELEQVKGLMTLMQMFSADLRPTSAAVNSALELMEYVKSSAQAWLSRLES